MIVPSKTISGLGKDLVKIGTYVEEARSLGNADTDHRAEESAVDPHFFQSRSLKGSFFVIAGVSFF